MAQAYAILIAVILATPVLLTAVNLILGAALLFIGVPATALPAMLLLVNATLALGRASAYDIGALTLRRASRVALTALAYTAYLTLVLPHLTALVTDVLA